MTRIIEATIFPLRILFFLILGFKAPKKSPELSLAEIDPLIFPLISRKPGKRMNIPGIKYILSTYKASNRPATKPPVVDRISAEKISLKSFVTIPIN